MLIQCTALLDRYMWHGELRRRGRFTGQSEHGMPI